MTTALVTGGAGLIGSHLVKELLLNGYTVIVADNFSRGTKKNLKGLDIILETVDLRRPAQCESLFARYKFDEVYHLAAFLGGVDFIHKCPVEAFDYNITMNANVLACSRLYEINKLLFTSTACIYPVSLQTSPDSPPLKEEDDYPVEPESGYGWAKLMTEYLANAYVQEYGMKIGIVRMFNVYGPGEAYNDDSHVIPMLCRKAIRYPKEEFIVWGDGTQTRSFIYAIDAARGIIAVMKDAINKGPVNIGTPGRITIQELAELITKIAGYLYQKDITIKYDTSKPTGVIGRSADISKATSLTNWKPEVSLEEGLEATIKWISKDLGVS